jgi:hypothetical protein
VTIRSKKSKSQIKSKGGEMDINQADLQTVAQSLQELNEKILILEKHYEHPEHLKDRLLVPEEILSIFSDLTSFNNLIESKRISPHQLINEMVEQLLKTLQLFPFHIEYDKPTQEKVNAVQIGLFSGFVQQINRLERNLSKWKIGEKVEKTDGDESQHFHS